MTIALPGATGFVALAQRAVKHEGKYFAAALDIRKVVVESLDREGVSQSRLLKVTTSPSARARTTALHTPGVVDDSWVGRFAPLVWSVAGGPGRAGLCSIWVRCLPAPVSTYSECTQNVLSTATNAHRYPMVAAGICAGQRPMPLILNGSHPCEGSSRCTTTSERRRCQAPDSVLP
jgi:hypothetical protein